MDPKAQALQNELERAVGGAAIEYQYSNDLHKFRLDVDPPHWLYVGRDFLDDHTADELIHALVHWQVSEALLASPNSRWLFLSEGGVRDVDAEFGRGRP
jgi:hypothetical protein